ncbi:MAG: type II secretion system F family protein [Nanoarchaeota archaeon]|nr:type II secretion system F family protein [Nanoarchaeota archaeon]
MIDDIKKNIESEMRMLRELSSYMNKLGSANLSERQLLANAVDSLKQSIKIVNDSIPSLVAEVGNEMDSTRIKNESVFYRDNNQLLKMTIPSKKKELLLKELSISRKYIKKLKGKKFDKNEEFKEFKAARGYLKLANGLFWNKAVYAINKGYFKKLAKNLQKANIDILFQSYVAMIFMTVILSFIISIFGAIFLLFFDINMSAPLIEIYSGNYLIRLLQVLTIPIFIPLSIFTLLYFYPASEKKSLEKRINQELSFAVIHMSAISGSGIQPSEIFRIIGLSKEYPYLRKEIRKVLNQINLYGYDLVTALSNASSTTSSNKLSELFSGLGTTITSGGDLSEFFDKRAETLLNDYRLERQKYAKTAETFMDIYISVVIAAPMILMLLLIMLTLGNFDIGFSTGQLTLLMISAISGINVVFLIFVHLNQPSY